MAFTAVYITYPDMKSAKKMTLYLLKLRLIACATLAPVQSFYWWKRKIVQGREVTMIAKTEKKHWEKIKREVARLHPYDTPCIIKLDAKANGAFESWVGEEVNKYV